MVEFGDVVLTAGKQKKRGSLSWLSPSSSPPPSSMDFRSRTSTKPVTIRLSDIASLSWARHFDGFTLRIRLQGGTVVKFSGFTEAAYKDVAALAATRALEVTRETVNTRGTNAGHLDMTDSSLMFVVDGSPAFELPLHLIAQAVAQSRHEVALELHHDEGVAQQIESLVEMRIHIPEEAKAKGEGGEEGEEVEEEGEDDERETPAQVFARDLQLRGDLGAASSTALAQFEKLLFSVPRGKYDVELFPSFLKLTSQTYTYKIAYKNVAKMFLFDLSDSAQHLFVIGLNPPVRQGRTAYPYLVVQFDSAEYTTQHFPAIDAATAEEKYGGLIKPEMRGPSYDVVTRVFKALMKKKVLIPSSAFLSPQSGHSLGCSFKASEGHLFFLEKSFFFVKKPPMHIRHAAITSVEIDRMSSANKRFGMKVTTNEHKANEYTFTNISRDEFDRVVTFLHDKGIHLITNGEEAQAGVGDGGGAGGRRRGGGGAGGVGDEDDPYLNRIKADAEEEDAEEGGEGGRARAGEDSDSDNDEDFTVDSGDDDDDASGGSSSDEEEPLESEVDESNDDDQPKRPQRSAAAAAGGGKKKTAAKKKSSGQQAGKGGKGRKGRVAADASDSASAASVEGSARGGGGAGKKKGVLSGYLLYSKERRPVLMKEQPRLEFGDLTRLIAAEWKERSEEEKVDYSRRAAQLNAARDEEALGSRAEGEEGKERGVKRKRDGQSSQQPQPARADEEMKGEEEEKSSGAAGKAEVMDLVKDEEEGEGGGV